MKAGYIKAERKGGTWWVREQEVTALLNRLPRQAISISANESMPSAAESNGTSNIPALLREQRDALLDYVLEPDKSNVNRDVEN